MIIVILAVWNLKATVTPNIGYCGGGSSSSCSNGNILLLIYKVIFHWWNGKLYN